MVPICSTMCPKNSCETEMGLRNAKIVSFICKNPLVTGATPPTISKLHSLFLEWQIKFATVSEWPSTKMRGRRKSTRLTSYFGILSNSLFLQMAKPSHKPVADPWGTIAARRPFDTNAFSFRGLCPWTPLRATPIIGLRYRARHGAPPNRYPFRRLWKALNFVSKMR